MDYNFTLWGKDIEFDDEDLFYIKLCLEGQNLAEEVCKYIEDIYDNQCSSLRDMERKLFDQIYNGLNGISEQYYSKLHEKGLYSATREQFTPYVLEYSYRSDKVIQELKELYQQLSRDNDVQNMILTYRNEETKEEIIGALYNDILYMHKAYLAYLEEFEGPVLIPFDLHTRNNAYQIYRNLYDRLVPEQFRIDACVEMLETWPLEIEFYLLAIELLGDENGELKRLAEFVGLSIDIESIKATETSAALALGDNKSHIDNILKDNFIYHYLKGQLENGLANVLNATLELLSSTWKKRTFIYSTEVAVLEKFNQAFEKFAFLEIDETPLVVHDSSLLKSGGSGFLITNKKIHADVFGKGKMAFLFDEIYSIDANTQYIILNKDFYISIESLEQEEKELIIQLIQFYLVIIPSIKHHTEFDATEEIIISENDHLTFDDPASIYNRIRSEELKKKLFYVNQNLKADSKLTKITTTYAKLDFDEKIIMGYDDTIFGSAKNGFLLTNKGIHIKAMLQKTKFIDYGNINEILLKGFSKDLYINNTEISLTQISERHSKEELVNLLKFLVGTVE
ncbi:hypothetical protein ACTFQN_19380 [Bacillus cereus group sp. MYBK30-1]|uniref:hypothetical protein n=1 Tax=unclassified Bacillus cereus group TaxID=2750818 RepID=UPI003F7A90EC